MTTREKLAHVLRRIGLGASRTELDALEPLGFDAAITRLLNPEGVAENFDVSPWEICHEANSTEIYIEPPRFALWWSLRLLMSQRPVEQRMTLFWHNHFAVGADKVELGPMMLDYIEVLRTNALGKFPDLLKAVSRTPAMLRYLDGDTSVRQHPNENFGRELLELFTVGPGHYTEGDIKEAARAFTGWGNRYVIFESGGEKVQERIRACVAEDVPMVAFSMSPDLHDDGVKKVMGEEGRFAGDDLLERLARRPETAQFICAKLWRFFGSPTESKSVQDRMVAAWNRSGGEIRAVLKAMIDSPEFWSDSSVRKIVKSPAEFVIPISRQFNLNPFLLAARTPKPTKTTPLAKTLRDSSGLIFGVMYKQGMMLLYPPNVGGWTWGDAWITQNNMLARIDFANLIFGVGQADQPLAAYMALQISQRQPADEAAAIGILLDTFDASLPAEKRTILVEAFKKVGGLASLKTPAEASKSLSAVCRLLFGSPEFQFC